MGVVIRIFAGFAEVRNIWGVEGNIVVGEPGSDSGYEVRVPEGWGCPTFISTGIDHPM